MAQQSPKIAGLVAIVLIASAGTGAVLLLGKKSETSQAAGTSTTTTGTATPSQASSASPTSTSTSTSSSYKDGTYSATGTYDTPDGEQSIDVSLTVQGGTVTSVSASGDARGESSDYQDQFMNSYKQYVVGKALSGLSLSRVSGSSLTSIGFNNALQAIQSKAQA